VFAGSRLGCYRWQALRLFQTEGSAGCSGGGRAGLLMTFNLLFLNEFPERGGGPHPAAGGILSCFSDARSRSPLQPAGLLVRVARSWLALGLAAPPRLNCPGPSLLLAQPLRWLHSPNEESRFRPASNVIWNLGTNVMLAVAFSIAAGAGDARSSSGCRIITA